MSRMRTFMYAAALAIGVVVLASRGSRAASAVTTTTTLPPPAPAYSLATGACIKEAAAQQKMCNMVASIVACQAEYDTAFSNCFAVGKGVSCAAACVAKNAKCTASATSTTVKPCTKSCQNDWVVAGGQCGGDHACLTAAKGDYKTWAGCLAPVAQKELAATLGVAFVDTRAKIAGVKDKDLRDGDVIGDDVMRRIQRDLDLELILLESREPVVESDAMSVDGQE